MSGTLVLQSVRIKIERNQVQLTREINKDKKDLIYNYKSGNMNHQHPHSHQQQQQQQQQQHQALLESLMSLQNSTGGTTAVPPVAVAHLPHPHHPSILHIATGAGGGGGGGVTPHNHHVTLANHASFFYPNGAPLTAVAAPVGTPVAAGLSSLLTEQQIQQHQQQQQQQHQEEHHRQQVSAAIADAHQQQQQRNLDLMRFRQQEQQYMLAAMRTDLNRYSGTSHPVDLASSSNYILAQSSSAHPVTGGGGGEVGSVSLATAASHEGEKSATREEHKVSSGGKRKRKRKSNSTSISSSLSSAPLPSSSSLSTVLAEKRQGQKDGIYGKSLKLLQSRDSSREVSSMEPLLEMVLDAKLQTQSQSKEDAQGATTTKNKDDHRNSLLAGSFVTNVVENEKWIFDLILNMTVDQLRVETEQSIRGRLQSSSSSRTSSSSSGSSRSGRDAGDVSNRHANGNLMNVSMDDIKNVAKVVAEDNHSRIRDAIRKAVALTYVEVVNRLDGMEKPSNKSKNMEQSNVSSQPCNTEASSPTASDDNVVILASAEQEEKWKEKYNEKLQVMMQQHEAFVVTLVEEHERRETELLNKIETQRVLHSRMVDNCLVASSKAVKIVRESILSDVV
jgi:hypothetical protein